jgi:hypothetical protein
MARLQCEYGKRGGMCVQKDAFKAGDRVLLIDDLVATGGTLSAGVTLINMLGATWCRIHSCSPLCSLGRADGRWNLLRLVITPCSVECACVVELKMFINPSVEGMPNRTKLFESLGFGDVPVWGLISEDILDVEAKLDESYVDDGEEH